MVASVAGKILVTAVIYFVTGSTAILYSIPNGQISPIWPPTGVALTALLLCGNRVWPGVFLGSFAVFLWNSVTEFSFQPMAIAASIATGASLQALVGAFLVRRYVPYPSAFLEMRPVFLFLLLAGPVSCLLSATWTVMTLSIGGAIPWSEFFFQWCDSWLRNTFGAMIFGLLGIVLGNKNRNFSRRRQALVALPLLASLALVVLSGYSTSKLEQERLRLAFERRTETMAARMKETFDSHVALLYALQSVMSLKSNVTRAEFAALAQRWSSRHPGLRTLSWQPVVKHADRHLFEEQARRDGIADFEFKEESAQGKLIRAGARSEYVPVYYHDSPQGNRRTLGFDSAADPVRRRALDLARESGDPAASEVLTLNARAPGILVYAPVFEGEVVKRRLRGYLGAALRVGDLVGNLVARGGAEEFEIDFFCVDSGKDGKAKTEGLPTASATPAHFKVSQLSTVALQRTVTFDAAQRRWRIELRPTKLYIASRRGHLVWIVVTTGLLFTTLLGGFLLTVTGHSVKIQMVNTELAKASLAQQAANEQLKKFAIMVDSSDDAIMSENWGGEIATWNRGAEKLYGYKAHEMIGRAVELLYPAEKLSEHVDFREKLARGEAVEQYETIRLKRDGTPVWVSLTLSSMKNQRGEVTGIVSVSRDITERKQAQERLEQHRKDVAQRLHDSVAQSLHAISLFLELIKTQLKKNPARAAEYVERVEGIASAEQRQLRTFLAELKGVQPVDEESMAVQLLERLARRLEQQWNLQLELQIDHDAEGGPREFKSELYFLLQEAVANAARHGHASEVKLIVRGEPDAYYVAITDDGCGFPFSGRYDEKTIQQELSNVAPKSLKQRVTALGGCLSIVSTDGGASVEFRLPRLSRKSAA